MPVTFLLLKLNAFKLEYWDYLWLYFSSQSSVLLLGFIKPKIRIWLPLPSKIFCHRVAFELVQYMNRFLC